MRSIAAMVVKVGCPVILVLYAVILILQYNQPPMERFPNWDSFWVDSMMVGALGGLRIAVHDLQLPTINPFINFGWNAGADTTVVQHLIDPFNALLLIGASSANLIITRSIALFSIGAVGAFFWLRRITGGAMISLAGSMMYIALPSLYTLTYGSTLQSWIFLTPVFLLLIDRIIAAQGKYDWALFALLSVFAMSVGNVYTVITLPCVIGTYALIVAIGLRRDRSIIKNFSLSVALVAVFCAAGAFYLIPLLYNLHERAGLLVELRHLGYHIVQRGDAMVATLNTSIGTSDQLHFITDFIGKGLLPTFYIPIDTGSVAYVPIFLPIFIVGYFLLGRRTCRLQTIIILGLIVACAMLLSETFVFYSLPHSVTETSTGRMRGQIILIPFLLVLAGTIAIAHLTHAASSSAKRPRVRVAVGLISFLALASVAWDTYLFIAKANIDIPPFSGRHELLSPLPSSNLVPVRWQADMWPDLVGCNFAALAFFIVGAMLDRKPRAGTVVTFGLCCGVFFVFYMSLQNDLRRQQGSWAWQTRNSFLLDGYERRHACLQRLIPFGDREYRVFAASKPVFGDVGNTKIATGRNWKLIAETELASADRTNMLWPYRTTDLPFASIVFSSITDTGTVQLNNMMPATTDQATAHLDLLRAIGVKWLISADTPVDLNDSKLGARLQYLGTCQSPLKPDLPGDPQEWPEGGTFFVYKLREPLGIAYSTDAVRVSSRDEVLRNVIRGEWAQHPGVALVDAKAGKVALDSIQGLDRAAPTAPGAPVSVDALTFNRVVLSTQSERRKLVVLTLADRPFWRATVNGQSAAIVRTFGGFMGVVVPAGRVAVTFTYVPYDVYLGASISLLMLIGCVAFGVAKRSPTIAAVTMQHSSAKCGD